MADNTTLNTGSGGDTIRTVAKTVNSGAKTQSILLDLGGGADGAPEAILTAGQATSANSVPVVLASDQSPPTVQTAALAPVVTPSAAATLQLKASAGKLMSLEVVAGATAGFVMLFDATSAPADGTVTPKWVYPVAANGALNMAWPNPLSFATGICAIFSSTGPFTKTGSATAFIGGQVQ